MKAVADIPIFFGKPYSVIGKTYTNRITFRHSHEIRSVGNYKPILYFYPKPVPGILLGIE